MQAVGLFCAVLGVNQGDYTIEKPKSVQMCVMINFKNPLILEPERFEDEDGEEEESYDEDDTQGGTEDSE